jgi:hypothetical protein
MNTQAAVPATSRTHSLGVALRHQPLPLRHRLEGIQIAVSVSRCQYWDPVYANFAQASSVGSMIWCFRNSPDASGFMFICDVFDDTSKNSLYTMSENSSLQTSPRRCECYAP